MRIHHPNLPYTKENGGVEVTERQYEVAWADRGWLVLEDEEPADEVTELEESQEDFDG